MDLDLERVSQHLSYRLESRVSQVSSNSYFALDININGAVIYEGL